VKFGRIIPLSQEGNGTDWEQEDSLRGELEMYISFRIRAGRGVTYFAL